MSALRQAPAHRFSAKDVVAGLSVAMVLIPQSMAYAELAGLPAHHGLYAAALPPILAAFFASSPYLQTGPGAVSALLTFGALVPLVPAGTGSVEYVKLAALLALVVGVVRVGVGLFKAGWLSYLMSRPMLTGFTSAAALLIVASQLPGALGSDAPAGSVLARATWALTHPGSWEGASVGLSIATVVLILGGRRIHPLLPGVLLAAAVGMAFSLATGYTGPTVGEVPRGFPTLTVDLPWSHLPALILPGAVIALLGFAEAASISRVFATEDRERWDPNREFVSQGAANLAAGLTGGFPVGASFSRSGLNRLAGARSRWSGMVTGLAVVAFLPFSNLLSPLPRAILAGIVVAAVSSLIKLRDVVGLWRLSKAQAIVGWTTFLFTLSLAPHVDDAVLIGVLVAGAVHLWRELRPEVGVRRLEDTLFLEPKGVLWFGSAPALDDELLEQLAQEPGVRRVVIDCSGLGRIDLTGAYTLAEMLDLVREAGIEVEVVAVPEHARRVLKAVALDRAHASGAPSVR